jgi:UDP-GlcNAc:undecaprenyl-phosphate GlcNAc-1-phosphate transferase
MAVLAAFLLFNLPLGFNRSVRTFMGDAGSTFIGLAIATIGISLSQGEAPKISPVNGLWLVALPVFDLFSAILRRSLQGKSPLHGDAGHLHHLLIESGLSRRSALLVMLLLSLCCAAFGLLGEALEIGHGVMLAAWFVLGALYYQVVRAPEWIAAIVGAPVIAKTALQPAPLAANDRVRPHTSLHEEAEFSE